MSYVKLEGFEELQAKLKQNVKLEDIKTIVKYHGSEMHGTAQTICPRRHGHLADSISIEIVDDGLTAEVEPHMNYAGYVEWGTRYMDAQPYIYPSWLQQKERFKSDINKIMK